MEYKCSNCGGELQFDPESGKLKCPFCGRVQELNEQENAGQSQKGLVDHEVHEDTSASQSGMKAFVKATDGSTESTEDLVVYECPHCGAEIVTDKTTSATTCLFCKTPLVIEKQTSGKFAPKYVVPFEIDKKRLGELYEQYIAKKPFYPDEYASENVIDKIQGIYLPYWLYDLQMNGMMSARGEHTITTRRGKYMVTDHMVYQIERGGSMDFWKIPVVASSKASEEAMNAIEPYNYDKLMPYNPGYLPGFLAQRYDQDSDTRAARSEERARESFESALTSTMGGYEGLHVTGSQIRRALKSADYAILPAYLLYMDYKREQGEDHVIAVNGQTGQIAGNIPVDKGKRNRYFILCFLLSWLILAVVMIGVFMMID